MRVDRRCALHERYRLEPWGMTSSVLPRRKCTSGGVTVEWNRRGQRSYRNCNGHSLVSSWPFALWRV